MKKTIHYLYFCGLLSAPIVLLILPADFFDKGQSLCLSVLFFNQTCYGCGMTRAIQHFIHFDFAGAYSYNKISVFVFPILVFVYAGELRRIYKKVKKVPIA